MMSAFIVWLPPRDCRRTRHSNGEFSSIARKSMMSDAGFLSAGGLQSFDSALPNLLAVSPHERSVPAI